MCYLYQELDRQEIKKAHEYNKKARKRGNSVRDTIQYMSYMLPADYEKWERSLFTKIMFYEKVAAKKYTGYCECGATVSLTSARSARMIECPVCKEKVRLTKNKSNSLFQEDYVAVMQKANGGLIQRLFVTTKHTWMENGAFNVQVYRNEEQRDYADGEQTWHFHTAWSDSTRWIPGEARKHGMGWCGWRIGDRYLNTYPHNIKALIAGTQYQYSALEIATAKTKVNPLYYLSCYDKEPKLEILYKMGLYGVAQQILYDDWDDCDVKQAIRKIKSVKDLGIFTDEDVRECHYLKLDKIMARKEVRTWGLDKTDYESAMEFVISLNHRSGEDFVYSFLSRKGMFQYYLTQKDAYPNVSHFIADYQDYIAGCHTLQLDFRDTAIKKPKSLKIAHDWAIQEVKITKSTVFDELIAAAHDSMQNLVEWSDGKLQVIIPQSSREIIQEGTNLSHCVGRYVERMACGESVILFIRKCDDPSKSYYTMEIKKDMRKYHCVQVRGYKNSDATPEVNAFLSKYKRWFARRSLGNFSQDSIMVRYYKAVHKKDNRYISNYDKNVEFHVGEYVRGDIDKNPDNVAVKGLHVASLEFAQQFGDGWKDVAILEVETNIHDVIIPDAKDQVRTSCFKVLREVPLEELGEWGVRHQRMAGNAA